MYIAGQYKKKNGFGGKEYFCRTELPVQLGSIVAIPYSGRNTPFLVTEINISPDRIPASVIDNLTEVTEFYELSEREMDELF